MWTQFKPELKKVRLAIKKYNPKRVFATVLFNVLDRLGKVKLRPVLRAVTALTVIAAALFACIRLKFAFSDLFAKPKVHTIFRSTSIKSLPQIDDHHDAMQPVGETDGLQGVMICRLSVNHEQGPLVKFSDPQVKVVVNHNTNVMEARFIDRAMVDRISDAKLVETIDPFNEICLMKGQSIELLIVPPSLEIYELESGVIDILVEVRQNDGKHQILAHGTFEGTPCLGLCLAAGQDCGLNPIRRLASR